MRIEIIGEKLLSETSPLKTEEAKRRISKHRGGRHTYLF